MANALESASLVMIPSGYEDGTLGSLKPTDGTGDFTFSRGSDISATRVNADGYIEKGYENLLLQSNSFLTTWALTPQISISGNQIGYDGTNDAWILEKGTNSYRRIYQNITLSGVWTFSVYAKANTLSRIDLRDNSFNGTGFDLSNGSIISSTNVVDSSIEIVNGTTDWYRCSVTFSASSSQVMISVGWADLISGSIYIQDAMLNQGLVAYPYKETTTAPVAGGILEDMPRLDYSNGSCPALLLEPQRTNLVEYSEYFESNTWVTSSGYTLTANATISPDGSKNAYKIQVGTLGGFLRNFTSVSSSTNYVFTFYAKRGSATDMKYRVYDHTNATDIIYKTSYYSQTSTTDWVRIEVPFTTGATTLGVSVYIDSDSQGNGYYYAYGAQLEQDATYETSYIPTYGVSQTRLKDVCIDAGDASTFNDSEGVLCAEIGALADDGGFRLLSINDGTTGNVIQMYYSGASNRVNVELKISNLTQVNLDYTFADVTEYNKIAFKYKENDFSLWVNGIKVDSDLSGSVFSEGTLNNFDFALVNNFFFYGNVNQVLYFPTALTDSECIELTTI